MMGRGQGDQIFYNAQDSLLKEYYLSQSVNSVATEKPWDMENVKFQNSFTRVNKTVNEDGNIDN